LIKNNIDVNDFKKVKESLIKIKIKLLKNEIINLNNQKLSKELREDNVSQKASIISSYTFVREYAVLIQKNETKNEGIIMDGRDTTFNIMPNADVKIFLDTDPKIRAKRRLKQNKKLGYSTNYENILKEIKIRDKRDRTRKKDPLHKTKDSHLIDSSNLTINQVVDKIIEIIENK
jgi:cytidylate kinase